MERQLANTGDSLAALQEHEESQQPQRLFLEGQARLCPNVAFVGIKRLESPGTFF